MRLGPRARRRAGVLATAVVVGAACLGAVGGGGPAGAATLTLPGGTWGQPQNIAGLAGYTSGGTAISCASLGNCAAVGSYDSEIANLVDQPFAVTETDGTWGSAQAIDAAPGAPGSMGALDRLSCGAPGYCTASGGYGGGGYERAYLATEVKGAWSVRTLPGTIGPDTVAKSTIFSVACTGAGDCTAVGWYTTISNPSAPEHAFTLDESSGTWGTPQPVAGLPSSGSTSSPTASVLASVSCSGPGDCTAGGYYNAGSGHVAFLVSESGGTWASAQAVPGFAKLNPNSGGVTLGTVTSVSCPSASDCAVAGYYGDGAGGASSPHAVFTVDEVNGTWDSAKALGVQLYEVYNDVTVGCRAAGNCVVTGTMNMTTSSGTNDEVFAAAETSGDAWGQWQALSGVPAGDVSDFSALSCVPGGNCMVVGYYHSPASAAWVQIFAATIAAGGTIGAAQPVLPGGTTYYASGALSCPQDGYCTMFEGSDVAHLLTEANPASLTLTASPAQVGYGSEPAETFTATVSSTAGGTPTGTVTVTGPSGAACTITLASGTGKCSFSPAQFSVGTYTAAGTYNGDRYYIPASATASVTVAKGKTATRLTPSAAVITPGQGTTDTLTVMVSPAGSVAPAGTVTVKDGSFVVCTITLASGAGSCTVNADQLITHGRVLTAAYPGDKNFLASTSPPAYLTIAPAGPRLAWPTAGRPAGPVSRLHGAPAPPAG